MSVQPNQASAMDVDDDVIMVTIQPGTVTQQALQVVSAVPFPLHVLSSTPTPMNVSPTRNASVLPTPQGQQLVPVITTPVTISQLPVAQQPSSTSLALPAPIQSHIPHISTQQQPMTSATRPVAPRLANENNLFLYNESGVCLGYFLPRSEAICLEHLLLLGQLISLLQSVLPVQRPPTSSRSSSSGVGSFATGSSSGSSTAASSTASGGSSSDVDRYKFEFAKMVASGDWDIRSAQNYLFELKFMEDQDKSTQGPGNRH